MKIIKLTKQEFGYLHYADFLPSDLQILLHSCEQKKLADYTLKIKEEKADEFRDLFGEQLQVTGFDTEYQLTKDGKILESLIDKFFC